MFGLSCREEGTLGQEHLAQEGPRSDDYGTKLSQIGGADEDTA